LATATTRAPGQKKNSPVFANGEQFKRVFQKLKHYRRIATRYERLAITYQAMLSLVASVICLNWERPLGKMMIIR